MADIAFRKFISRTLAPGVLLSDRRKLSVRQLAKVEPDVLRAWDEIENPGLQALENRADPENARDLARATQLRARLNALVQQVLAISTELAPLEERFGLARRDTGH